MGIPHIKEIWPEDDKGAYAENLRLKHFVASLHVNTRNNDTLIHTMPFSQNDITAGSESELQAVVIGKNHSVDLPITIRESSYYKNLIRRAASGDTSEDLVHSLEAFLNEEEENIWENSWVRFPRKHLSLYANKIFESDLLADKTKADGPKRLDCHCFHFFRNNEEWVRLPVSYLLKISLADAISSSHVSPQIRLIGSRFMKHFLNDNTSPETFSFYPVLLNKSVGLGKGIADETVKRYFLCQLLTMYANKRFKLTEAGQEAMVYFAPHPPIRQKRLNQLIPDSFYRELFMSPCLSGWNRGEEKHRYMALCHQVLSRSQLNTISKLKEAGIITRNLIVLPNISNISLANNGTHVSLGSRRLTHALKSDLTFDQTHEKYYGDLAIKIIEHFLPLFVGTYSGAPYRIDFWDFHPEKVLGFLPHELDFTHLRMIWRRWKKKAKLKCFGQPVTPFGPEMMDRMFSKVFGLKGDFIIDFRLIDYLACLLSTDQSPALDGSIGNDKKLLKDLESFGVFDSSMSIYLLYRLRQFGQMGFSGFEGRYYSLFHHMGDDMGNAVNLQILLSAYAYKLILKKEVTHAHIPDTSFSESERRQIFFGTAIGIPTFYMLKETKNIFLKQIIQKTRNTRLSSRYPGYIRVHNLEYRKALLRVLREDAGDLIEMFGLSSCINDLYRRVDRPDDFAAYGKLTGEILSQTGVSRATKLTGDEFNSAAETYYRSKLRESHIKEGIHAVIGTLKNILNKNGHPVRTLLKPYSKLVDQLFNNYSSENDIWNNRLSEKEIYQLIHITLLAIHFDMETSQKNRQGRKKYDIIHPASVH